MTLIRGLRIIETDAGVVAADEHHVTGAPSGDFVSSLAAGSGSGFRDLDAGSVTGAKNVDTTGVSTSFTASIDAVSPVLNVLNTADGILIDCWLTNNQGVTSVQFAIGASSVNVTIPNTGVAHITGKVRNGSLMLDGPGATGATATAPGQVTGLGLTPGDSQLVANWTAPSDGGSAITDYKVEIRNPGGSGSYTVFSDGTSTSTSATITGLTNGTSVDVRVSAINAVGTGTASSVVSATPSAGSAIPTTGLALWLKADAITGKVDGDAISSWTDSSSNSRNAVQATGGAQPVYKTGILNSLPAVRMDGSNDFLAVAASGILDNTHAMVFLVYKRRSAVASAGALAMINTAASDDYADVRGALIGYEGGSNTEQQIYRNSNPLSSMGSNAGNVAVAMSAWFDGSNNTIRVNGTSASPGTDTGTFNTNEILIGARWASSAPSNFNAYDYCEVIVYNVYDGTTKTAVQSYLATKYGITV